MLPVFLRSPWNELALKWLLLLVLVKSRFHLGNWTSWKIPTNPKSAMIGRYNWRKNTECATFRISASIYQDRDYLATVRGIWVICFFRFYFCFIIHVPGFAKYILLLRRRRAVDCFLLKPKLSFTTKVAKAVLSRKPDLYLTFWA